MTTPPFDPPYWKIEQTEQGPCLVETLADGSTRHQNLTEQEARQRLNTAAGPSADSQAGGSASPPKARRQPSSSARHAGVILKVPFAEKDQAKKLGARWNAEKRTWYVPHGTDIGPFKAWCTDDTKTS